MKNNLLSSGTAIIAFSTVRQKKGGKEGTVWDGHLSTPLVVVHFLWDATIGEEELVAPFHPWRFCAMFRAAVDDCRRLLPFLQSSNFFRCRD